MEVDKVDIFHKEVILVNITGSPNVSKIQEVIQAFDIIKFKKKLFICAVRMLNCGTLF